MIATDGAHDLTTGGARGAFQAIMLAHALQEVANDGKFILPFGGRFQPFRGVATRNIDTECGYPNDTELDPAWLKRVYTRWGIPRRYVNIWPDECWASFPTITDDASPGHSEFEDAFVELDREKQILVNCHQADRLSRIGEYGVIFLGFDDGGRLDRPPAGVDPDTGERKGEGAKVKYNLNYLTPLDQTVVRIAQSEKDTRNPRFGQPKAYSVQFVSQSVSGGGVGQPGPSGTVGPAFHENKVHWTRMIHVVEPTGNSKVLAVPPLWPIVNHLMDLRKVVGGSAEMFWKGGFPGYAFETYPDLAGEAGIDQASLSKQISDYQHGLQRYLATVGGRWNSLQPQVANPANHIEWYVRLICATDAIPTKTFLGSESGHLAAKQDDESWQNRVRARNVRHTDPVILRQLVNRLILFGCLPPPKAKKWSSNWRDQRTVSDKERVDIALKKMQSLQTFYSAEVDQRFPNRLMLTLIMGFSEEEADAIEKQLKDKPPPEPLGIITKPAANPGGLRNGKASKGAVGRPAGRVEGDPKRATKPGSAGRRAAMHANLWGGP